MSTFAGVEGTWTGRLGTLRNVVRQHVVAEQLREHLSGVQTVLDVGCGQGTQAVALASLGLRVTGVDPSPALLGLLTGLAGESGCAVEALEGDLEGLREAVEGRSFDLVCAHGLLMYLPDGHHALATLVERVARGGLLSFTFRNADALAYRPGVRGQWRDALRAFTADTYVGELGARARATRLVEALGWCHELGLTLERWYGVRVFTDGLAADEVPDPATLDDCLAAETEAGRRDPYRHFGSQIHVVARRD